MHASYCASCPEDAFPELHPGKCCWLVTLSSVAARCWDPHVSSCEGHLLICGGGGGVKQGANQPAFGSRDRWGS